MSKKLLFKGGHATGMIPCEIEDFSTLYLVDARVDEKTKAYIDSVIGNSVLNLCPYRNVLVTHKYDTVEGNVITLDDCQDDEVIQLSEVQGNTMVNCCKDGELEIAPEVMYNEGEIIVNFNKNELLMKEYGFKTLVEDKAEYDERYQTLDIDKYEEQEDKIIAKYVVIDNDLDEEKEKLILKSKEDLQVFLEEHPLFSKAKYEDGRYYNITAEKQQQLTSKLLMYNGYTALGKEYKLMWNDTGELCEEWSFQELFALSCEIDIYVTQLAEYQRAKEVELKDCDTVEKLYQVVIDYETMK